MMMENAEYVDNILDIYTTVTNCTIILEQPLTRWLKNTVVMIETFKGNN